MLGKVYQWLYNHLYMYKYIILEVNSQTKYEFYLFIETLQLRFDVYVKKIIVK